MKKEVKSMKSILFGLVVCFTVIFGSVGNIFSDYLGGSNVDFNSTTIQEFANVPSTAAASWCSNTTPAIETSTGMTLYANRFTQPTFGRNLIVGATFNCFDNFIATSIINGYALVRGTDTMGQVVTDSITFQSNSRGVGSVPFIYISSFTVHFTSVSNITPAFLTIEVGEGLNIGLNSPFNNPPLYILENEVRTSSASFNQRYSTFKPRSAQNGVNDFKVNYHSLRRF